MRTSTMRTTSSGGASPSSGTACGRKSRCRFFRIPARPTIRSDGARRTTGHGSARSITTSSITTRSAIFRTTDRCRCRSSSSNHDVMRLLMTADAVGGVWGYTLELARALAAHGVDTTVATMGPAPTPDQIADAADIAGFALETRAFKLEWMRDARSDVDAAC